MLADTPLRAGDLARRLPGLGATSAGARLVGVFEEGIARSRSGTEALDSRGSRGSRRCAFARSGVTARGIIARLGRCTALTPGAAPVIDAPLLLDVRAVFVVFKCLDIELWS